MEERLERAEKLRESHLLEKIRKAQEEDMKVRVHVIAVLKSVCTCIYMYMCVYMFNRLQ